MNNEFKELISNIIFIFLAMSLGLIFFIATAKLCMWIWSI